MFLLYLNYDPVLLELCMYCSIWCKHVPLSFSGSTVHVQDWQLRIRYMSILLGMIEGQSTG